MMIELKLSNMILQFYLVVNPYYLAIISKVFFLGKYDKIFLCCQLGGNEDTR